MWPFKQIKKWFQKTIHNWQVNKVNTALGTFRDIIESGGSASGKKQQIKSAMSTLKQYPYASGEAGLLFMMNLV
jgi:hypothetical protein